MLTRASRGIRSFVDVSDFIWSLVYIANSFIMLCCCSWLRWYGRVLCIVDDVWFQRVRGRGSRVLHAVPVRRMCSQRVAVAATDRLTTGQLHSPQSNSRCASEHAGRPATSMKTCRPRCECVVLLGGLSFHLCLHPSVITKLLPCEVVCLLSHSICLSVSVEIHGRTNADINAAVIIICRLSLGIYFMMYTDNTFNFYIIVLTVHVPMALVNKRFS